MADRSSRFERFSGRSAQFDLARRSGGYPVRGDGGDVGVGFDAAEAEPGEDFLKTVSFAAGCGCRAVAAGGGVGRLAWWR